MVDGGLIVIIHFEAPPLVGLQPNGIQVEPSGRTLTADGKQQVSEMIRLPLANSVTIRSLSSIKTFATAAQAQGHVFLAHVERECLNDLPIGKFDQGAALIDQRDLDAEGGED